MASKRMLSTSRHPFRGVATLKIKTYRVILCTDRKIPKNSMRLLGFRFTETCRIDSARAASQLLVSKVCFLMVSRGYGYVRSLD